MSCWLVRDVVTSCCCVYLQVVPCRVLLHTFLFFLPVVCQLLFCYVHSTAAYLLFFCSICGLLRTSLVDVVVLCYYVHTPLLLTILFYLFYALFYLQKPSFLVLLFRAMSITLW